MLLRSDLQYQFNTTVVPILRYKAYKSLNTFSVLTALNSYYGSELRVTVSNVVYCIRKGYISSNDSLKMICVGDNDIYVEFEFFNKHKALLNKYMTNQIERLIICKNLDDYFKIFIKSTAKTIDDRVIEKKTILESLNVRV